jgi:hypothetical protein
MNVVRRGAPACAVLAALALPGAAAAHVTVTPRQLAPGAEGLLVFSAPNERDRVPLTELTVTLPPGFLVGSVETKSGWDVTVRTRTVTWTGGSIPPRQFATFAIRAVAPQRTGSAATTAIERFGDGRASTFHPRLAVEPSSTAAATTARPGRDSGARTLGRFALGVGLAGILLAAAAGFLALRSWLLSPDPDGETGGRGAAAGRPRPRRRRGQALG